MQPQHVEDGPSAVVVAALQPRRPPSLSLTSTQPGAARAGNTERKDNAAATTFASTSSGGGCRTLSPPLRQQQQQQQASRSAVGGSPTSLSSRARASIASLSLRHQWKLLVSPRNPSWRQSGGTSSTRPSPLSSPGVVRDELPAGGGCSGSPTHLSPVPGGPTPRLFTFNGPPPTSPLHARAAHAAAHAAVAASPVQTPAGTPRRRPTDLRVEHSHSHSGASLALDPDLRRSLSSAALAHAPSFLPTLASAAEQQQTSGRGVSGDGGQEQEQQQHPRDSMHFGDDGSLRLGGFDIGVGGLLVDTEGPDTAVSSSPSSPVPGIAASPCGRTPRFSLAASVSSASLSAAAAACAPEDASCSSASTQGQGNLIVVGRLGKGNGGTVLKALHLPTMKLVALKSVPIYSAERRQQMVQELSMLYSNLADIDSEEEAMTADGPDPAEAGAEATQGAESASAGAGGAGGERRDKRQTGHRRGGQGAGASASSSAGASLSSHGSWRGGSLDSASSCSSSILSILTADGNDDDDEDGEQQQQQPKTKHEKVSMSGAPPPSHPIEGVVATAGSSSSSAGGSSSALGGPVRKRISFCEGDPTTMGAGAEATTKTTAGPAPTASPSQRGPPPPPCPFGHELRKGMAVRGAHSSRLKLSLAQPDPEEEGDDDEGKEQKKRPSAAAKPHDKAQQQPQQQPPQQHCPHIVSFYDVFSDPARSTVSLVVEYMDGGSLEDLVQAGGCDDEAVLASVAAQVLRGLRFLHERHKVHRDVKPGNLLLNSRGQVKLADFGVARKLGGTSDLSRTFVGTVGYMSPERIQGLRYNAKADIWGFGLSLMACALGRFPYQRQVSSMSYFELATAVCDEPSPELPPDKPFSPQLRDFLRLCLHKDPLVRPSAASLLAHPLLQRVARTPSSGSSGIQAAAAERPASPYGSKLQRGQLAKRELHQIADALAAHFGGGIGGSSGRRSSGLVRVSSSCAGSLGQAGLGVSASASGHGALGVSSSGTHAHGGPCGGLPSITAKQLRRLADNLKLDQAAVREALQGRLQGLVALEGGGGGDPTASGFSAAAHVVVVDGGGGTLRRSLSSSSLGLGLSGSMQHQHQHQHHSQASSMSPTRRMSSLMRRSSAGGSTGTGPEGAGGAGSSSLAPIQGGKHKDWAGRRTASAAGCGMDDRQPPGGVGCCHMM